MKNLTTEVTEITEKSSFISAVSVVVFLDFFAAHKEMQILRCAQDDMSF
jgi:hypothetical protein